MTTINTKRELIDYLWDWSESKGLWAQLLVNKITATQSSLSTEERKEVFNYYLENSGFKFSSPLPQIEISKPSFASTSKEVVLKEIKEIKGVNKLADDQIMEFSPNITVVYGNNGVGKTGYSRVLKAQGYSFDNNDEILSNVHQEQTSQSAKINFTSNGSPYTLDWSGGRPESDLNAISVFNSDCVNISLSNSRGLLVTPEGFYLFALVSEELSKLNELHRQQYNSYPTELPWRVNLREGTPQKQYIESLSADSSIESLETLGSFSDQQEIALTENESELKKVNKEALQLKLKSVSLIYSELTEVLNSIKLAESTISKENWLRIIKYNDALTALNNKTHLGIAGIAESYALEEFNTDEFTNFLKSADAYIKILAKEDYPQNENDTCVYCQQDLRSQEAKSLIESYSRILNDTTQRDILTVQRSKDELIESVRLINDNIVLHQPLFGTEEDGSPLQPQELLVFNAKIKLYKEAIIGNLLNNEAEFNLEYSSIITFIESFLNGQEAERNKIVKLLEDLSNTEKKIKASIDQLKDRQLLSFNKEQIVQCINNLKAHKLLDDNKTKFSTQSLTLKMTQAREELVAQDFQEKFTIEMTKFRKQHLGVSLSFFSQSGGSKLRQGVANFNINKVLSEGEQKAIALCEFLTELQLDTSTAPVVLDDPVNSLDHHIIMDVARRLTELAKERQVIIFTHNVIFYNSFFSLQKNHINRETDFKYYKIISNESNTGILTDGAPINKLRAYTGKINAICDSGLGDRNENQVAAEGYDYLRTALELLVSNSIFKEIVGRYRSNIMMTKFPEVKGDMIETHKATIDELFSRASGYIKAHSHPEEQDSPPTMNDLKADFQVFKTIESDFRD